MLGQPRANLCAKLEVGVERYWRDMCQVGANFLLVHEQIVLDTHDLFHLNFKKMGREGAIVGVCGHARDRADKVPQVASEHRVAQLFAQRAAVPT